MRRIHGIESDNGERTIEPLNVSQIGGKDFKQKLLELPHIKSAYDLAASANDASPKQDQRGRSPIRKPQVEGTNIKDKFSLPGSN